jgi:nicotinamidase-related amidase
MSKILVIVDAQNEFITGVLGNEDCKAAVSKIVSEIRSNEYAKVIITKDTHGEDYLETQEGKRLPIVHGQIGTEGHELNKDIADAISDVYDAEDVCTVQKSTFGSVNVGSILQDTVEELLSYGIPNDEVEIVFVGFCTGICVINNVVMAKTFCPEQRVCVVADACACVTPETHKTALDAMKTFQVDIIGTRIDRIVERARHLEAVKMTSHQEPEIGINEETKMIAISKYDPDMQCAIHLEDFCALSSLNDIELEKLRRRLDDENIAYVL